MIYETESMSKLRALLTEQHDLTDAEFETFKQTLVILEDYGFGLKGPAL